MTNKAAEQLLAKGNEIKDITKEQLLKLKIVIKQEMQSKMDSLKNLIGSNRCTLMAAMGSGMLIVPLIMENITTCDSTNRKIIRWT